MRVKNSCNICSGSGTEILYNCRDYLISGEVFELIRCTQCGLISTNNAPKEIDIGKYYKSENYISHSNSRTGLINSIYHLARKFMLGRKYRLVRKYTGLSRGTILDIGTGTGYFPYLMRNRGWIASGIESDKDASRFAFKNFGIEVGELGDLKELETSSFDAITLWHVLEHLYHPKDIVYEIEQLLKINGVCIIAVPNSDSYDAGLYKELWAAWDVPRHLWHFNTKSFRSLIAQSRLEIVTIKRMPLDAFYVSMLSEKNRGSKLYMVKGGFVGLMAWGTSLLNKPKSSSLIYILRKKV